LAEAGEGGDGRLHAFSTALLAMVRAIFGDRERRGAEAGTIDP
jgi:hypothetical protein